MTRFLNPSIGQATYLLNFREPQQKVRFSQGDAEVAFGSFGAGQSQQTNVLDDADPAMPRIVFVRDRKNISISQMSVNLVQVFEPSPTSNLEDQFAALIEELQNFHRQALEYKPAKEYSHIALVLQVNYPSAATTAELHKFVYDKFIAFQLPVGELASVQLSLGYKVNDLFVNIGASVYEARQFEFKNVKPGSATPISVMLSLEDAKVMSKGVQFTVDVNDRPRHIKNRQAGAGSPEELFGMAAQLLNEQLPKLVSGK
jgi:hypothetical protein